MIVDCRVTIVRRPYMFHVVLHKAKNVDFIG